MGVDESFFLRYWIDTNDTVHIIKQYTHSEIPLPNVAVFTILSCTLLLKRVKWFMGKRIVGGREREREKGGSILLYYTRYNDVMFCFLLGNVILLMYFRLPIYT